VTPASEIVKMFTYLEVTKYYLLVFRKKKSEKKSYLFGVLVQESFL